MVAINNGYKSVGVWFSNGETRKLIERNLRTDEKGKVYPFVKDEAYWNIKYNTDGNNVFTFREQVQAMEKHYSLSLTKGTTTLLRELNMFSDIVLELDSVNDKSLKSKYDKMTKEFEAKMHAVYTKIADMGLLEHNKVKK